MSYILGRSRYDQLQCGQIMHDKTKAWSMYRAYFRDYVISWCLAIAARHRTVIRRCSTQLFNQAMADSSLALRAPVGRSHMTIIPDKQSVQWWKRDLRGYGKLKEYKAIGLFENPWRAPNERASACTDKTCIANFCAATACIRLLPVCAVLIMYVHMHTAAILHSMPCIVQSLS